MTRGRLALLASVVLALPACGGETPHPSPAPADTLTPLVAIRNARIPADGVLSGGQPTREQIAAAASGGFTTVINLRTEAEPGFEWERDMVEGLGMHYVQIPIAGADGLTRDNVARIDETLDAARDQGPVLLHCGSGNRIGAWVALRDAWIDGRDPVEALATGRAAGLTGLEPTVRELLGLDPAP